MLEYAVKKMHDLDELIPRAIEAYSERCGHENWLCQGSRGPLILYVTKLPGGAGQVMLRNPHQVIAMYDYDPVSDGLTWVEQ